jgi:hypothetical protein
VAIIVALLAAWRQLVEPYRRQADTMTLVQDLEGDFQTSEAAIWQRAIFGADFRNVTMVQLADCTDPDKYLRQVVDLPRLQSLAVGGAHFTDTHLRQLRGCNALRVLVLDSTAVSPTALAEWQRDRPHTHVYQSERLTIQAAMATGFVVDIDGSHAPPAVERAFGPRFFGSAFSVSAEGEWDFGNPNALVLTEPVRLRNNPVDDAWLVKLRGLTRFAV